MAKKAMLQKLNPIPKRKVQKSKVQKLKPNMILLARSESLTEREYGPNMDVKPLMEGTDLNMIKQEEIELETETMECDKVFQLPNNSVPITSDELVKNEPESFVVMEEVSNPDHAKTTVSISARTQRKNVAKERLKLMKERDKIAKEQAKRQNKRARNPARYEENIAQLPDYSEISQSLNQELSDTNLNDNGVEPTDETERNVTEISNTEAELNSRTSSNNVSSIDIDCSTNVVETESEGFYCGRRYHERVGIVRALLVMTGVLRPDAQFKQAASYIGLDPHQFHVRVPEPAQIPNGPDKAEVSRRLKNIVIDSGRFEHRVFGYKEANAEVRFWASGFRIPDSDAPLS